MASITNSILDQIKLSGGVLESSCQANSKTFIWNPISLRFASFHLSGVAPLTTSALKMVVSFGVKMPLEIGETA